MLTEKWSIILKPCPLFMVVAFLSIAIAWSPLYASEGGHHLHGTSADSQHSHAPDFSDPNVLAPVPDGWTSKLVEHQKKYQDADLVLALGQQSYPLFYELIQDYAKTNNLNIVVEQGTCGITSGRLLKKLVDVGAFCCPPGMNDRLPGLKFYSLGISPIALVVHPDNQLMNVSSDQARKIFAGEVTRWSEVDPDNSQLIQPVGRLHCKTRPGHWRALLESGDEFSPRLFEVGVISDMISQVARNTGSIGWETPLMVDSSREDGKVKTLNIDGHSPMDIDYVLTGKYPLYRSYSLTLWDTNNEKKELALKLIRFLQQHVENVHKEVGFIPVSKLKKSGWKFTGEELVGEPENI